MIARAHQLLSAHLWMTGARYRMFRRKLHRKIERKMLGRA